MQSYLGLPKDGMPWLTQVALGRVQGAYTITMAGAQNNLVVSSPQLLWQNNSLEVSHATAEPVTIVSTSNNDTAAGTGWRTVQLHGLDDNFGWTSEIITMNGTTPVVSQNSYRRMNRVNSVTVGSAGGSAGVITVRQQTSTELMATNLAGVNNLSKCYFCVPRGFYGLIYLATLTPRGSFGYESRIHVRESSGLGNIIGAPSRFNNGTLFFESPYLVNPEAEMFMTANLASGGAQVIEGFMQAIIVPEHYVVAGQNIFSPE